MRRKHLLAASLLLLPLPAVACLWDYDTLATEAKGLPDVVRVITGRFERNPPLYYEMRLARVAKRLESDPTDLAAYDDAGVACDRLGRDDEAIAWMEKKRAQLDRIDPSAKDAHEHRYRYLANLGTFHAHRWFRAGADRSRLDDMTTARDLIAEAIRLNPAAHFGREKYQLMVMEWVLDESKEKPTVFYGFRAEEPSPAEAIHGLSGLITLGNAWESVDVFNALTRALDRDRRTSMAYLSKLRVEELIGLGRRSMATVHDGNKDGAFVARIEEGLLAHPEGVESAFPRLRREAETWHRHRTEYMLARLKAGRHPDTDPTFWKDFRDNGPPGLEQFNTPPPEPSSYVITTRHRTTPWVFALAAVGVASLSWHGFGLARRLVRSIRPRKARWSDDSLA